MWKLSNRSVSINRIYRLYISRAFSAGTTTTTTTTTTTQNIKPEAKETEIKKVVIGGGTGFIGSQLATELRNRGCEVTVISRFNTNNSPDIITWDQIKSQGLPQCDAVVNLAGQHILDMRRIWTEKYKQEVIQSRVGTTKLLVDAINKMDQPAKVFVSTAGKCFYGTSDPRTLDESSPAGSDFPGELCDKWEAAARGVSKEKCSRHVQIRIGVVLGAIQGKGLIHIGKGRGFLPIVRLPFCLGLGGVIGSGKQYLPWIHIDDMVDVIIFSMFNKEMNGIYNGVAPGIVTNEQFTREFARHLHRRVMWHIPPWLVKAIVGRERAGIVLEGQYVVPKRTLEAGYRFQFPTIDSALSNLVRINF